MDNFNEVLKNGDVFQVSVDYSKINSLFSILSSELTKTNKRLD